MPWRPVVACSRSTPRFLDNAIDASGFRLVQSLGSRRPEKALLRAPWGSVPALDAGAFDEFERVFAWEFFGSAGLLGALSCAFVLGVASSEPEQLDYGVVGGDKTLVLDDLAELLIQRLDAVGGVDDLAHLGGQNSRTGMSRFHASRHSLTVAGYLLPHFKPSKMSSSVAVAAAVGTVAFGRNPAAAGKQV